MAATRTAKSKKSAKASKKKAARKKSGKKSAKKKSVTRGAKKTRAKSPAKKAARKSAKKKAAKAKTGKGGSAAAQKAPGKRKTARKTAKRKAQSRTGRKGAPYEYDRIPIVLVHRDTSGMKETYGGALDTVVLEGQHLKPRGVASKTVLIFMHPSGVMNLLPFPNGLARNGIHVMTCGSRYPHNDTALIMEKVAIDLGQYVKYAKEQLGYENVILAGWSGGGSLSLFYQSEAEDPSITATPASDPPDLTQAGLIPVDGVMQLAAHVSRAITLTEWLDASILDEQDPSKRDIELDLYDPRNPNQPPYSAEFIARYAEAQIARSARIRDWVRGRLEDLKSKPGGENEEFAFVVHGTMAAPCWLDPNVDANDRKPRWCYMGDPQVVNMMPAGLGRYSSLRSWLSQWSYHESRADGPKCASRVTCPVLVIQNSADDACPPSHAARIYAGFRHEDKEFHEIKGATHYYMGQPALMQQAISVVQDWMGRKGFS